jgi:hypothetical protein
MLLIKRFVVLNTPASLQLTLAAGAYLTERQVLFEKHSIQRDLANPLGS